MNVKFYHIIILISIITINMVSAKSVIKTEYKFNEVTTYYDDFSANFVIGGEYYADSKGTLLKNAKSLKSCEYCNNIELKIQLDKNYNATLEDFNYYNVLNLCLESEKEGIYPLKILSQKNYSNVIIGNNIIMNSKDKYCINLSLTKSIFDTTIKWGDNSTIIETKIFNNRTIADIYGQDSNSFDFVSYIQFSIRDLPSRYPLDVTSILRFFTVGNTLGHENSTLSVNLTDTGWTESTTGTTFSNSYWESYYNTQFNYNLTPGATSLIDISKIIEFQINKSYKNGTYEYVSLKMYDNDTSINDITSITDDNYIQLGHNAYPVYIADRENTNTSRQPLINFTINMSFSTTIESPKDFNYSVTNKTLPINITFNIFQTFRNFSNLQIENRSFIGLPETIQNIRIFINNNLTEIGNFSYININYSIDNDNMTFQSVGNLTAWTKDTGNDCQEHTSGSRLAMRCFGDTTNHTTQYNVTLPITDNWNCFMTWDFMNLGNDNSQEGGWVGYYDGYTNSKIEVWKEVGSINQGSWRFAFANGTWGGDTLFDPVLKPLLNISGRMFVNITSNLSNTYIFVRNIASASNDYIWFDNFNITCVNNNMTTTVNISKVGYVYNLNFTPSNLIPGSNNLTLEFTAKSNYLWNNVLQAWNTTAINSLFYEEYTPAPPPTICNCTMPNDKTWPKTIDMSCLCNTTTGGQCSVLNFTGTGYWNLSAPINISNMTNPITGQTIYLPLNGAIYSNISR